MRYDAVHFFLDESGNLSAKPHRDDPLLLGGVLLFGPYDRAADDRLRALLSRRLAEAGGRYPADLHFYQPQNPDEVAALRLTDEQKETLLRSLTQDLTAWADPDRAIYGVHLTHARDLFPDGFGLMAEGYHDNRYLAMLWALVEHLVFVDDQVRERLQPRAAVHLHIASRTYVFDKDPVLKEDLEAQGWKVEEYRQKPGKYCVYGILQRPEVRGMFRVAMRQRWHAAPVVLGEIEVEALRYKTGQSTAALYLADLYLGLARLRLNAERRRFRPPVRAPLLPVFRQLEYGPGLEVLARQKAALDEGDVDQYLALAAEVGGADPGALADRLERRAAELLEGESAKAAELLERACREVDRPGRLEDGLRLARLADRLLTRTGAADLRAEVLSLQVRLSQANHTGDVDGAAAVWEKYLRLEPRLHELGREGLRLRTELRNRRAVSLTDRFAYDEAERLLADIGRMQEEDQAQMAARFAVSPSELPNYELGACFGTLGQVCAFRSAPGDYEQAEACFRKALSLFPQPADQERQLVYLGHLACDQGEAGRALWNEVAEALPELSAGDPVTRVDGAFVLALQVKGVVVFAPPGEVERFLEHWNREDHFGRFPTAARRHHPLGLVRQALALGHTRLWREGRVERHGCRAREWFRRAAEHLESGPPLLRALGAACRLRGVLFDLERDAGDAAARETLAQGFNLLTSQLAVHFGDAAWKEDGAGRSSGQFGGRDPGPGSPPEERARCVLKAVRFNYW